MSSAVITAQRYPSNGSGLRTARAARDESPSEMQDDAAEAVSLTSESPGWLELDEAHVAQSPYRPPLVLEGGEGCVVWDVDGRRFLDFESGQFCMATGHGHPRVVAAIGAQAAQLMQIGNRFTSPVRIELAQRLAALSPEPLSVCLFGSTGSEANETALRLAKRVTGRFETVALERGYHGRTLGSFGLSSSARGMRRDYGPMAAGTVLIPTPYPYRCRFGCGDACDLACFDQAVETVDRATSGAPAAVVVEFVLGAGGVIPVPANWARELRAFCTERGALLIADEALTGIGRTGRWFAFEHTGVVPDLVVTSKALGGGVPVSAVLTSAGVARRALDSGFLLAASHQGDPFQCAVALANLDVVEQESLVQRAAAMGDLLGRRLAELERAFEIVGQVRGVGLLWGVEIVRDAGSRAEAPELAAAVTVEALERGLIVGGLRPGIREANVLRLAPPLVMGEDEIERAVSVLADSLTAVQAYLRT
jgi:4-aminobutyrate aminotransferase-like enzyme